MVRFRASLVARREPDQHRLNSGPANQFPSTFVDEGEASYRLMSLDLILTSYNMSSDDEDRPQEVPAYVRLGRRKIPVPRTKLMRTVVGTSIVVFGVLPGLPGVAAVPVGMTILSVDYPHLRRHRRRITVWGGRRWQRWRGRQGTAADDT